MAMIADLTEHHLQCCNGGICEIGMNVDMFRRVDELTEKFFQQVRTLKDIKQRPEILEKVKLFNLTFSMFVKLLLQDCSDRPTEYTDLRFTRYVVDKAATFKQFLSEVSVLAYGNVTINS